jgi:hypothetical protein
MYVAEVTAVAEAILQQREGKFKQVRTHPPVHLSQLSFVFFGNTVEPRLSEIKGADPISNISDNS